MPFFRISRDRRGYEYFCLVHVFSSRRGKVPRTLYWFRSPPNLKVGRAPLDEDVMRALEARHPDVAFDWEALRRTPMPPPSAEYWKERRRAVKAMRQFHATDESVENTDEEIPMSDATPAVDEMPGDAAELAAFSQEAEFPGEEQETVDVAATQAGEPGSRLSGEMSSQKPPEVAGSGGSGHRRRRRRRRGQRGPAWRPVQTEPEAKDPAERAIASSIDQALEPSLSAEADNEVDEG